MVFAIAYNHRRHHAQAYEHAHLSQQQASQTYATKEKDVYVPYLFSQHAPHHQKLHDGACVILFYHPASPMHTSCACAPITEQSRQEKGKAYFGCCTRPYELLYARGVYAEPSTIRLNTVSQQAGWTVFVLSRWCSDVFNRVVSLAKSF